MASGGVKTEKEVEWGPGVKEDMRKHGLNEDTIGILGLEDFSTYDMIDKLDEDCILAELKDMRISGAQRCAFRTFMKARKEQIAVNHQQSSGFMTHTHIDILRKCKSKLASIMRPTEIIEKLRSEKMLTDFEAEHINSKPTRYEKVVSLTDIIMKAEDGCFWSLIKALFRTKHENLVNFIGEQMNQRGKSYNIIFIYAVYVNI